MSDPKNPPDIYAMLFEQTPLILRYVLGLLTFGLFSVAGVLYRWHRADLARVNHRIDVLEKVIEARHEETNRLLLQISINTRQARDAHVPNSEDQT